MKKYFSIFHSLILGGILLLTVLYSPHLKVWFNKARFKAKIASLNKMMPSSETLNKLIDCTKLRQDFCGPLVEELNQYYEAVIEVNPNQADAYGMLGFCQYYLGHTQKAIECYQKAHTINPRFFWYPLHLGQLYFQSSQFEKSIAMLQSALKTSQEQTFIFITNSKQIYLPLVLARGSNAQEFLKEEFAFGLYECYKFLVLNYAQYKDYPNMLGLSLIAIHLGLNDAPKGFFHYQAGFAALQIKEYERAVALLSEYLKLNPDDIKAYKYLALALEKNNHQDFYFQVKQKAASLDGIKSTKVRWEEDVNLSIY